jgi:titin
VYATNKYGDSSESSQTTATPATVPGAPTALVAQPASGGISVSFATPATNGGDAITGYTITVTPLAGGAATTRTVTVGSSPYAESITGLSTGASYSVDVTATNTVGTGTAATVALVIPGRPSAPQSVSAEPRMGGAHVTWTAPAYDGAVAIASYYVRAYTAGTTTLIAATAVSAANLSAGLTGLTDGTAYDITVTAAHGAIAASTDVPTSQGVESAAYRLTAGRPLAPTNVTATADDGQIMVSWSAVADVTGIAVTGYTITYTAGSSATSSASSCTAGSCSSTLTGLVNGTTYSIVVAAVSTAGTGPSSSPAVTATPRSTPGQPASVSASSLDEAVEVTWTAPSSTGGSAITGYDVTVTAGATTVATYSLEADQTSVTAAGLTNGTSYVASVSARNIAGSGTARASAATTPIGAPSAPTNLSAEPNGSDFDVTWSAPSSTGGSAITGYTVIVTDPDGIVTEKTVGSAPCSTFSCTVSSLDDGEGGTISTAANTRYTVSVRATNAAGDGPAATDAVVIPGQPSAPRDIIVTDDTSGFHICLLAPLHTPGGAVTAYGISITEDGIDTGLLAVEVASWSATPCAGGRVGYTVTTLANGNAVQNGSTYAIEVAATSSTVGSVSAYATDAVFGPDVEGTATPYAAPAAPIAVIATAGDGLITMTLTAGSARGRTITNYEWSVDSTNGSDGTWTAFSPAQTNGTFLLTGLTNGTSYRPWLRAVNAVGSGTGTSASPVTPVAPVSGGGSGGSSGSSGGSTGANASGSGSGSTAAGGSAATARLSTLTVRTKAKTPLAKILKAAGLKTVKGAKITIRGTASRKVLAITSKHVTAKKDGTYTLTITVKPKKGASSTATLVLVATKSGRMLFL